MEQVLQFERDDLEGGGNACAVVGGEGGQTDDWNDLSVASFDRQSEGDLRGCRRLSSTLFRARRAVVPQAGRSTAFLHPSVRNRQTTSSICYALPLLILLEPDMSRARLFRVISPLTTVHSLMTLTTASRQKGCLEPG